MKQTRKEALIHTALDITFDLLGAFVIGVVFLAGAWVGSLILEVLT